MPRGEISRATIVGHHDTRADRNSPGIDQDDARVIQEVHEEIGMFDVYRGQRLRPIFVGTDIGRHISDTHADREMVSSARAIRRPVPAMTERRIFDGRLSLCMGDDLPEEGCERGGRSSGAPCEAGQAEMALMSSLNR